MIGEFRRIIFAMRRWWWDIFGGYLFRFSLLLVLFYSAKGLVIQSGVVFDPRLSIIRVVGLMFWFICIAALASPTNTIGFEQKIGMMEQLCVSRFSLVSIVFARSFWEFVIELIVLVVTLQSLFFIAGVAFNILPFLLVFCLVYWWGWGLGLVIGGLTILIKRTEVFLNPIRMLILVFSNTVIPIDGIYSAFKPLKFISPISLEMKWISAYIMSGKFVMGNVFPAILVSLGVILFGVAIFNRCFRYSKDLGVLANY